MPVPRPISPWWVLALAPVALGVGWVVGGMPGPSRPADESASLLVAAPEVRPAVSPIEPRVAITPSHGPRDVIYSEWTSYADAVRQSRENGKPVLLDFSAEWCEPCQQLRREVFESAAAGTTVKAAVIPVALVDSVREAGKNPAALEQLERRFDVQEFPTLVVFSPATGRASRRVGYAGVDETLRWITETAAALP